MRKVLLIMTLLLAMVAQGAWAQTTTYTSYTVTGGSVSYYSSQEHDKLLDNNTGTKWCTVFGDGSTATATCGEWVEFNTTHAIIPTGYILTTCEDTDYHYGRNPKNWTLKGKLNAGDAWTVLTDVTNASMPQTNHTDKSFDISNTDRAYKYFRFEVNAIDGSTYGKEAGPQAYKFQLSRLLLKGTDAMFDASFATGSGGTGWSISPTSATDGTTVSVSYTGQHRVKSVKVKVVVKPATVTTVPTATTGDILAGSTTALVSAGVPNGGTMMYAVTTANTKPTTTEGFSETVPTAQTCTAGTYYVWYYVKADGFHTDSDIAGSVSVTVKAPTLANVFTNGAVVVVKFNTENSNWCGVTGTYEAGTSTFTTTGSGTLNPTSVSMTKNGDKLVVSVTSSYNTMTVTFNTTTNKYTLVDVTESSSPYRMTSLNSITVFGTDITSTLTEYVPVPSTVTWDFSALSVEHEGDQDLTNGYTNDGVTLQGAGCTLNFHNGVFRSDNETSTFTAPTGKKFTSIVINYDSGIGEVSLTGGFKKTSGTATWSGKAATFSTNGYTDRVTSIVFTLVEE